MAVLTRFSQKSKLPFQFDHIEGWLSQEVAELLYQLAKKVPNQLCIVEIGSWKGRSTVCLASGAKHGHGSKVYAIDPHIGSREHQSITKKLISTYHEFIQNLQDAQVKDYVTPLKMTSQAACSQVTQPIGLLWIDGSHDYTDVYNDFISWFPKLDSNGWILFHDSKWPGVRQVLWEEFFGSRQIGPIHRREDTTYARKLSQPVAVFYWYNQTQLFREKSRQWLKNKRRRFKKLLKKQSLTKKSLTEILAYSKVATCLKSPSTKKT